MQRLFVIGGATVDLLIYLHEFPAPEPATVFSSAWRRTVGGTGAGKTMALSKLGFSVDFHAFLGDDADGRLIERSITDSGARLHASIDPKGSETHTNLMDKDGRRISIYTNYATFEPEISSEDYRTLAKQADAVIVNISNYARAFLPMLQELGKEIWTDLHDFDGKNPYHADFLSAARHVFFSSDQMPDWRAFMERQIRAGKKTVVCTHGKKGASGMDASGAFVEAPALPLAQLVDSNGAGDNFFAGFMAAAKRELPMSERMLWGSAAGALCCASPELVHAELSVNRLIQETKNISGGK